MASVHQSQWPAATPRTDALDPHLRLLFVTVLVRDQERSLRFYVDQLGFKVIFDNKVEGGGRFLVVGPPDGTAVLALLAPAPGSPEYERIGRSSELFFITEDVVGRYEEWSKRGVHFVEPPHEPVWGGLFAVLEDIDGNPLRLVGSGNIARELEEQRRSISEKQEAERRIAQELAIAKQVQARLFPQTLPHARTLDYAGLCIQARQVGGDYYDFLTLGRDRLGLILGDIAGKGMPAALLMVNLQANLRSQCGNGVEPQRLLQSVNRLFYENTVESSYATLFFAEYDDRARRLRYANCGHYSAILLRADDTLERLESTCTVLGLFEDWDCTLGERRLFPGDVLALYTDGISEASNPEGEEFGEERLVDALQQNRDLPAQSLVQTVVDEVRQFSPHEQHDDITLIVAKCREDS